MSNIWLLFKTDMQRITRNLVTMLIVMGLVLMPSIFSWYNILACWDVFENTDNLTVAVANTDVGYESDLIPVTINVGEQVVSDLHNNDDLNWVFVSEEEAIEGAESGEYYAAVIIPESFSQDMMTFYSDDVEHAKLIYYSNEKKNAIAPNLINNGADQVATEVNEVFTETISELALALATSISEYADDADATSTIGDLSSHISELGTQMNEASQVVQSYAAIVDSSQALISGSATLLEQAGTSADEVMAAVNESKDSVSTISDAVSAASDSLGAALSATAASYDGVAESVDQAFDSSTASASETADAMRMQADAVQKQAAATQDLLDQLKTLRDTLPSDAQSAIDPFITRMEASVEMQQSVAESLNNAATSIDAGVEDTNATRAEVDATVEEARQSVSDLSTDYENNIKPQLETLMSQVSSTADTLMASAESLSGVGSGLQGEADSLVNRLEAAQQRLQETASKLSESGTKLTALSASLDEALNSGDMEAVRTLLSSDPEALATALSAPVQLERNAVFPAENFGSQMAPLYCTLGLWIGCLLAVVAIKASVTRAQREELPNWKYRQLFFGRFGVFSVVAFLQSTIMALGNMFFLEVQVSDPVLYLLCFWIAGQVFMFIMYTLVISFANLGKAIGVFLLIIQVTSGGGSYPLQILPEFFQVLSPFIPATHVVNAMRAAMMGVYENDFWIEIGQLLLFVIPFLLLGLLLRKPLMKFLNWYVDKAEESKLVS